MVPPFPLNGTPSFYQLHLISLTWLVPQFIGRDGVVTTIHDSGDIIVRYSNNKILLLNAGTLTKASKSYAHFPEGVYIHVHLHRGVNKLRFYVCVRV